MQLLLTFFVSLFSHVAFSCELRSIIDVSLNDGFLVSGEAATYRENKSCEWLLRGKHLACAADISSSSKPNHQT